MLTELSTNRNTEVNEPNNFSQTYTNHSTQCFFTVPYYWGGLQGQFKEKDSKIFFAQSVHIKLAYPHAALFSIFFKIGKSLALHLLE